MLIKTLYLSALAGLALLVSPASAQKAKGCALTDRFFRSLEFTQ